MRIAGAVLTALVALTVVSGCTGHASSTTSASSSTFVYAPNLDVVTDWDPATSYSNEIRVMGNVYETLTRYNTTTKKVEPLLATSWKSSDDGRTWTFTLRDGVKFHSGRTL
ncbi:MAG: ABC transporter substrate-binding protein, partial [Microbacterium sp. 14-71-5]